MAELISLVALGVAIWALRATYLHRAQDKNAELGRLTAHLRGLARSLDGRPEHTKGVWHNVMAARGTFHSGARMKLDQELDSLSSELREISGWVSRLPALPNISKQADLNRRIIEAIETRDRLLAISDDLQARDAKAAEIAAEARQRAYIPQGR